jgi:hypothetical protein
VAVHRSRGRAGRLKIGGVVGAIGPLGLLASGAMICHGTLLAYSYVTQFVGFIDIFMFVVSLVVWLILKAVVGIRVSEEAEINGLGMHELLAWKYGVLEGLTSHSAHEVARVEMPEPFQWDDKEGLDDQTYQGGVQVQSEPKPTALLDKESVNDGD